MNYLYIAVYIILALIFGASFLGLLFIFLLPPKNKNKNSFDESNQKELIAFHSKYDEDYYGPTKQD